MAAERKRCDRQPYLAVAQQAAPASPAPVESKQHDGDSGYYHSAVPCPFNPFSSTELKQAPHAIGPAEEVIPGLAYVVHNLMSPEECRRVVLGLEGSGHYHQVGQSESSYRFCERSVMDSESMAATLWDRLGPWMAEAGLDQLEVGRGTGLTPLRQELDRAATPRRWGGAWSARGLNPRFRLVKYRQGGKFDAHCDGQYEVGPHERSWWTVNLYLSDVEDGAEGETEFIADQAACREVLAACGGGAEWKKRTPAEALRVRPRRGAALVFYQPGLLHAGRPLKKGVKYLMRSDVRFVRDPDSFEALTEKQEEAVRIKQLAEELELAGQADEAWKMYRKAFKMFPALEDDCG